MNQGSKTTHFIPLPQQIAPCVSKQAFLRYIQWHLRPFFAFLPANDALLLGNHALLHPNDALLPAFFRLLPSNGRFLRLFSPLLPCNGHSLGSFSLLLPHLLQLLQPFCLSNPQIFPPCFSPPRLQMPKQRTLHTHTTL